ncbi:MAG TPA: DUF1656 domain-containing protein [Phycisphaerae bacterium]|nr:DUF1656 domain-containing protein [Phycisphaerae bacterium]
MFLPLREVNVFGMLVDPAAALLANCAVLFFVVRYVINSCVDLNRFVWRRPLIDLALFVILYSLAVLTLRPI